MKKANRIRVVEKNLSEHVRQEQEAYRAIVRKNLETERAASPGPSLVHYETVAGGDPVTLSFAIKVF
jgi:hypothetical protein